MAFSRACRARVVLVCVLGVLGAAGSMAAAAPLPATANWTAESDQANALLGWAALTAGDVNGDGFSDVVVGAPNWDSPLAQDVGKVFVYHGSASGLGTTPAWTMEGSQAGEQFGYSAGTAGDVNGDGFDDLIVGAVNHTNDQQNEGAVYVYLGSASGLAAVPAWSAEGNQAFSGFGHSVARAGDVNSDGFDDVVIGAPLWESDVLYRDEGRALIFSGGPGGLQPIPSSTYHSFQADARLGASVAGAGDVDGDGFADVIVGAYQYTGTQFQEGRAFLFSGHTGGLTFPIWTGDGGQSSAWYGVRVATAGDTNGDGYSDIIVGTWFAENDQAQEGKAYIYLGSATGPAATPAWTAEGNETFSRFGAWVGTAGDVNGDGLADIIVGQWLGGAADEGKAYVYLGSSAGPAVAPAWTATGNQPDGQFGLVVGTAGDVNGDGFSDVIVGAAAQDAPQVDEGRAYVYHGRAEMPAPVEAWSIEGNQTDLASGQAAASAGDVNGDGFDDVIVGTPYYTGTAVEGGRAEVYLGSGQGLSATPAWSVEGAAPGVHLGQAVAGAGDVNGDGFGDVVIGVTGYSNGEANEGQVQVYFGSPTGLGALPGWTFESNVPNAFFGGALASAGDVDGDGLGDLLVGSPAYPVNSVAVGQASLFAGWSIRLGLPLPPAFTMSGTDPGDRFGAAVSSAGDVDGNGYSDVLVGAFGADAPGGPTTTGSVWLMLGRPGGLDAPLWRVDGTQSLEWFGVSVATAGDVNGDGYSDIVVGAPFHSDDQTNEGRVFVYLGSPSGPALTPSWTMDGNQSDSFFGYSVAGAGDVDGDGYSDLSIGALGFDADQVDEGRVLIFQGSASGPSSLPFWSTDGNLDGAYHGTLVKPAGDVNADGFADLVVGAYGYTHPETEEGRVVLYPGNGGYGRPRLHRQVRFLGGPIAPLGLTDYAYGVRLGLLGRTAEGRGRIRMQWEVAPLGVPLDGSGAVSDPNDSITDVPGAGGSLAPLVTNVGLWPPDWQHHWRVRTLGKSPLFPRSPWITPAFNGVQEADFRTPPPCRDFDGDGFGNPGQLDCPMGAALDCHDGNASIYPGAPEACDGLDNDCNAVVDDVPQPEPVNTLRLDPPDAFSVHFDWTPLAGPHVYDIIRGDLGTLHSSGGDYTAATIQCLVDGFDYGGYISWVSGPPPVGSGWWFMIRASCGGVNGTYEEGLPAQVGLRDGEIQSSGLDCP